MSEPSEPLDELLSALALRAGSPRAAAANLELSETIEAVSAVGALEAEARQRVVEQLTGMKRVALLNPSLLGERGLTTWFFFAAGRTGHFDKVIAGAKEFGDGISHYVLYGDWDSLIMLHAGQSEAEAFGDRLTTGLYEAPLRLRAARTLVSHGIVPPALDRDALPDLSPSGCAAINELVDDFDAPARRSLRDELVSSSGIIGAAWSRDIDPGAGVCAYVGLHLQGGRSSLEPSEVLRALLGQDALASALRDVYQIDSAHPYHYLVKVICVSMAELNVVTDQLSLMTINGARVKGTTFVVAARHVELARLRPPTIDGLVTVLASDRLVSSAETVFNDLAPDQRRQFNELLGEEQLRLTTLYLEMKAACGAIELEDPYRRRVDTAIQAFVNSALANPAEPSVIGPVVEVATGVEEAARAFLAALSDRVFQQRAKLQTELKLPTRKVADLSLGKVANALQAAAEHPEFAQFSELLDEVSISNLLAFADQRNLWAHGNHPDAGLRRLDSAARMIVEATQLLAWLSEGATNLRSGQPRHTPTTADAGRDFFISHASEDKAEVALPLAEELKRRGYSVWVDRPEMTLGDSLRESIDSAIATAQFGVVILSPAFFVKSWTQAELNGLFARQVGGEKRILPVWHQVDLATVQQYSPMLADRVAVSTDRGLSVVADEIVSAFKAVRPATR